MFIFLYLELTIIICIAYSLRAIAFLSVSKKKKLHNLSAYITMPPLYITATVTY